MRIEERIFHCQNTARILKLENTVQKLMQVESITKHIYLQRDPIHTFAARLSTGSAPLYTAEQEKQ
jgi:hypothetical protein